MQWETRGLQSPCKAQSSRHSRWAARPCRSMFRAIQRHISRLLGADRPGQGQRAVAENRIGRFGQQRQRLDCDIQCHTCVRRAARYDQSRGSPIRPLAERYGRQFIDQRTPGCTKANARYGGSGGLITYWGAAADSVIAGNQQYDTNGIVLNHTNKDPGGVHLATSFQSSNDIRGNLLQGAYTGSGPTTAGTEAAYSSATAPICAPRLPAGPRRRRISASVSRSRTTQ